MFRLSLGISNTIWQHPSRLRLTHSSIQTWVLCFSGRISTLSVIQHSLYVGVVEITPPPPLTGEQYGKMEPKYPEGGHCQSVYVLRGVKRPPSFLIIQWKRQRHLMWSATHNVVTREINPWKSFDLLLWSNLWWYIYIYIYIYILRERARDLAPKFTAGLNEP